MCSFHFRQATLGVANAKMVKSKTWCLNRLNYDGIDKIFYLNEGDTMVGRNKSADISLTSKISSRNHCVINLSNDDTITIRNQVNDLTKNLL